MSAYLPSALLAAAIAVAATVVIFALVGTSASSIAIQALIYGLIAFVGTLVISTVIGRRKAA